MRRRLQAKQVGSQKLPLFASTLPMSQIASRLEATVNYQKRCKILVIMFSLLLTASVHRRRQVAAESVLPVALRQ